MNSAVVFKKLHLKIGGIREEWDNCNKIFFTKYALQKQLYLAHE